MMRSQPLSLRRFPFFGSRVRWRYTECFVGRRHRPVEPRMRPERREIHGPSQGRETRGPGARHHSRARSHHPAAHQNLVLGGTIGEFQALAAKL